VSEGGSFWVGDDVGEGRELSTLLLADHPALAIPSPWKIDHQSFLQYYNAKIQRPSREQRHAIVY